MDFFTFFILTIKLDPQPVWFEPRLHLVGMYIIVKPSWDVEEVNYQSREIFLVDCSKEMVKEPRNLKA